MKLCKECHALVGRQLMATGRHSGLTTYYGRRLADDQEVPARYQYYQCEDCGAVMARQRTEATPDSVWKLVSKLALPPGKNEDVDYAFEFIHGGGSVVAQ